MKIPAVVDETQLEFVQEALASWQSYQNSGLHLTGEEARDWLGTWGTDDETAVPECHK